ncbi:interleukin-17 receptor D-like isoform X1 [Acipenser oxyrinchus oxyrinchus]|uniref:Interleukin-17 receptor D-like isoform X1 n=1 Tax=Acipenser oxyrinchus oxyrinchus TaxID=40147 RepID=A0AAD8CI32_ACIOX|nr:interleukin-17 receptor D-like isoform X1 [Acipenser oxyrinchus oxyrinchus]
MMRTSVWILLSLAWGAALGIHSLEANCMDACLKEQETASLCRACKMGNHIAKRRKDNNTLYSVEKCTHITPCFAEGGTDEACSHGIGPPQNLVASPGNHSHCPQEEELLVRWNPSEFGIVYLHGFFTQVIADKESVSDCKRLRLHKTTNVTDYNKVFEVAFCVPLNTNYSVLVHAYPIPIGREKDDNVFATTKFRPRDCELLYGKAYCQDCQNFYGTAKVKCLKSWVPGNVTVSEIGTSIIITFEVAPDSYGIGSYYIYYQGHLQDWQNTAVKHETAEGKSRLINVTLKNLACKMNYTILLFSDLRDSTQIRLYYYLLGNEEHVNGVVYVAVSLVVLAGIAVFFCSFVVYNTNRKSQPSELYSVDSDSLDLGPSPVLNPPNPLVFLCCSHCEGPGHTRLALALACYLQEHCGCQVILDLWEELAITRVGHMTWLSDGIESSDFVVTLCSRSLKRMVDMRAPSELESGGCPIVATASLIGEKIRQSRISTGDLSKFIAVTFESDSEYQIPRILELASKYKLMEDFPKLFCHLHSLELYSPGSVLQVSNITQEDYFSVRSGYALYSALKEVGIAPNNILVD